jgi:transcriptional regulator with XRE-family HTH domain
MESFGAYLATALKAAGLSQNQFAKLVRYPQQHVSAICVGKRPPPLRHVSAWAKVLAKHIEVETFTELAELAHSTPRIQRLVADLKKRLAAR